MRICYSRNQKWLQAVTWASCRPAVTTSRPQRPLGRVYWQDSMAGGHGSAPEEEHGQDRASSRRPCREGPGRPRPRPDPCPWVQTPFESPRAQLNHRKDSWKDRDLCVAKSPQLSRQRGRTQAVPEPRPLRVWQVSARPPLGPRKMQGSAERGLHTPVQWYPHFAVHQDHEGNLERCPGPTQDQRIGDPREGPQEGEGSPLPLLVGSSS